MKVITEVPAGARCPNWRHTESPETWGFYYWSLGVYGELEAAGPVRNLSSVIYPQAVGNYGSLGVCELLLGEPAQRAPGKQDHAIGHLP